MNRNDLRHQEIMEDFKDGIKHDKGKLNAGFMIKGFANALKQVAEVSTFGVTKYGKDTWQGVERERYQDALFRHLLDWVSGEKYDEESGLKSLAHAAWNILAILELEYKNASSRNLNKYNYLCLYQILKNIKMHKCYFNSHILNQLIKITSFGVNSEENAKKKKRKELREEHKKAKEHLKVLCKHAKELIPLCPNYDFKKDYEREI